MARTRIGASLLAVLAVAAPLVGCGSDETAEQTQTATETTSSYTGELQLLDGRPAGYDELEGEATLERSEGQTTASLQLTGLEPEAEYISHVHERPCSEQGGPHYKFDPQGADMPPNEIHLPFVSDAEGAGEKTVTVDRVAGPEAVSIVVHEQTAEKTDGGTSTHGGGGHGAGHGGDTTAPDAGRDSGDTDPAPRDVLASSHGEDGHGDGHSHSHQPKIACADVAPEGASGRTQTEAAEGSSAASPGGAEVIEVEGAEPVGGVQQLEFDSGEQVRFAVRSDVADEVHVHGYDILKDVEAGGRVSFTFPADIEGIFEVELEQRRTQIAELRVNP